jgi:glycosyltransferase involved in cell wall biosynthesis
MNILLAAPTFGVYGGIEAFVIALADWLQQNTANAVKVCFKRVADCGVSPNLEDRCKKLGLDHQFVSRGSAALLRDIRWADVVHGNTCSPDIALLSKLAGKPLVVTVHNRFRGHRGLRNRIWWLCNRVADWRTYNSTFVLNSWEPRGRRAGSELIPTVCHLPEREAPFEARRGFFFVARLIENKGADILVKAYASARIDKALWPLSIAGDGPLRSWLQSYVTDHRIAGVEILGFLSEQQKSHRISHAKWLVAPANTMEDMGLTPIEARSVGVPSIVTRDGGLPESAGESALICEPGNVDQLASLLEQAAEMPETEYRRRAAQAKDSLQGYLRPLSAYMVIYERLASRA